MESANTTDTPTAADVLADGVLSVAGAVEFTQLSRAELYREMAAGRLAYVKHGTRRMVPKRSLVALLAAGLVLPTATGSLPGRATSEPPSNERLRKRPVLDGATTE